MATITTIMVVNYRSNLASFEMFAPFFIHLAPSSRRNITMVMAITITEARDQDHPRARMQHKLQP